jgi:hypothetical protein
VLIFQGIGSYLVNMDYIVFLACVIGTLTNVNDMIVAPYQKVVLSAKTRTAGVTNGVYNPPKSNPGAYR